MGLHRANASLRIVERGATSAVLIPFDFLKGCDSRSPGQRSCEEKGACPNISILGKGGIDINTTGCSMAHLPLPVTKDLQCGLSLPRLCSASRSLSCPFRSLRNVLSQPDHWASHTQAPSCTLTCAVIGFTAEL